MTDQRPPESIMLDDYVKHSVRISHWRDPITGEYYEAERAREPRDIEIGHHAETVECATLHGSHPQYGDTYSDGVNVFTIWAGPIVRSED